MVKEKKAGNAKSKRTRRTSRRMYTVTPRSQDLGKTQDSIINTLDEEGKKNPLNDLLNFQKKEKPSQNYEQFNFDDLQSLQDAHIDKDLLETHYLKHDV